MNLATLKSEGRKLFETGNLTCYMLGTTLYRVTMNGTKVYNIEAQPASVPAIAPTIPVSTPLEVTPTIAIPPALKMPEKVKRAKKTAKYTFKLIKDFSPMNPCEDGDLLSKFLVFHPREDFGNCKDYATPDDFRNFLGQYPGEVFVWPLYMYDHSGITISLSPFSCTFDSSQVGWVWVPMKDAKNEGHGNIPLEELKAKIYRVVESEVKMMDAFVSRECYGFELFDENEESVDSRFGYYGEEDATEAAKEAIAELKMDAKANADKVCCANPKCNDSWNAEDMEEHEGKMYCPICYVNL